MNARSTPLIRFGFLIAGILVLAFPVNLPAWDNLNAHGAISESAAYYFKNLHGPDLKYGNSSFDFSTTFQGRSYKVDYARLNEYTGHQPSLNFVSWMGEGGFTADVDPNTPPNGFTLVLTDKYMAMRHFFNATPGALRHLTDCFVVTWITDPPVNIIDWSIDFPGTKPSECHYYGFKQALQMYKAGLEQSNFIIDPWTTSNATETLFAAAFRALGETLHGTADLAVPAHVRNDGHGFGDNTFNWARVEPLEYTVFTQQIRGIVSLDPTSLSVPAEFDILGNPTPRVLMERLAKFTNENFYSQDTFNIPEWSVKPKNYLTSFPVAPDPPLPNLYDSSKEGQFGPIFLTKQFGNGKTVVMAKESPSSYLERFLSAGIIKKPRSFDIFKDQALSQAQVLVPAAVKACAEVIDRFWPTMVLSITGTPDTQNPGKYLVSGTLEHLIAQDMGSWNDLLPGQPIRYKGPGKIRKRNQGGSFDDLANVSFADASFTATPLTLTNGDVIKLQVWAGARVYLSPEHTVSGIVTGTPPAAPSNVLATKGNGSVTLTWDNVTGAASYTVYWSNTSGVTKANGTPLANKTTPFTHTGRTNGATYYYVVTAVNANGESVESTQVSATPQASTGNPLEITLDATTGLKMRFAQIPANTFTMGCPADEPGRWSSDWPPHQVTLTKGFYMGETEVTQAQYQKIIGTNPSYFIPTQTHYSSGYADTSSQPVETVSWFDSVRFCNALSVQQSLTPCYQNQGNSTTIADTDTVTCDWAATGYRLPTEAEWEYACRGSPTNTTAFYWGSDSTEATMKQYVWYNMNAYYGSWTDPHATKGGTQPVGTKLPNAFGLFDMSGNVWEWCNDWWENPSNRGTQTDPRGPSAGSDRVYRGGGWGDYWVVCRSADRDGYIPDYRFSGLGFRLVRTIP